MSRPRLRIWPLVKRLVAVVASVLAFALLAILFLHGRSQLLRKGEPIWHKLPKSQAELNVTTEEVLEALVRSATEGGIRRTTEAGSDFFESSFLARPAREVRESVKRKIENSFQEIKRLPEAELQVIKEQIYEQWFKEEVTTDGGD